MISYTKALKLDPRPSFERIIHKDAYAWRRAAIVGQNIEAMARRHRRHCGVLTITFEESRGGRLISNHNALHDFKNLLRTYLKHRFEAGIFLNETTEAGRVHIHALVVFEHDLTQGFDWMAYDGMKRIGAQAREERRDLTSAEFALERRLSRSVTSNVHLRTLWSELRDLGAARTGGQHRRARCGRCELVPVRGSSDQLAKYLVKALAKGCQVGGLYPKTRRFGSWGWTWESRVSDRPRGMRSERYRRNMKLICDYLGVEFIDSIYKPWMRENFGPKWGWHSLRASTLIDRYRQAHLEQAPPPELLLSIIQETIGLGCR